MALKKWISLFFVTALIINSYSQSDYVGMLVSLNGKGTLVRNGNKTELSIPQIFHYNDELYVSKGQVGVLLFSSKEIVVRTGEKHVFNPGVQASDEELLAYNHVADDQYISQVNASYRIRGVDIEIFPLRSKIIDTAGARIYIRNQEVGIDSLKVRLFNKNKPGDEIWQRYIKEDELKLNALPVCKDNDYLIEFSAEPNFIVKGELKYTFVDTEKLDWKKIKAVADYIKAIDYCYEEQLHFKLIKLLEEASKKYPDYQIFEYLRQKHVRE